jgi:F0F1-type ATP synthase assembly protein I
MIDSPDLSHITIDEPPDHSGSRPLGGLTLLGSGISGVGCVVPILVIAAIFVGRWLDEQAGTKPWIMLALVFGSVILGLVVMVSSALSAVNSTQDRHRRDQ